MIHFADLDPLVSLTDQLGAEEGPVVLVNIFTVDAAERDALLETWAKDADLMKQQPGFISTQLHQGIGGSSTLMNYAVWESVAAFRAAFQDPDFQRQIQSYPPSTVARPHLFRKLAVPGICLGD